MANTVAIYDPQFITRQGLVELMKGLDQFTEVRGTPSKVELDALLNEKQPTLLVVDYLPDNEFGPQEFTKIKRQYPELKTLVISDDNDKARIQAVIKLSLIHISEPTRLRRISYAVFCLKKKNKKIHI